MAVTRLLFCVGVFLVVLVNADQKGRDFAELGLRVSAKKCQEYKEFYREAFMSGVSQRETITGKVKCPANPRVRNPFARRGVFKHEFPHTASLWYEVVNEDRERVGYKFRCSGSLISKKHVLVPGHCIYSKWGRPTHVVFGDSNLYDVKSQGTRQVIAVGDVIMHPNYVPPSSTDDLAIIVLAKNVKYDIKNRNPRPTVRPACLPPDNIDLSRGAMLSAFENKNQGAHMVEHVGMIGNNKDCEPYVREQQGKYFDIRFGEGIRPNMMCTKGMNSETCLGDMGATLLMQPIRGMSCMDVIVGVLAVNATACNEGITHPYVFTRIDRYLDWIERVVWPSTFKIQGDFRTESMEDEAVGVAPAGNVTTSAAASATTVETTSQATEAVLSTTSTSTSTTIPPPPVDDVFAGIEEGDDEDDEAMDNKSLFQII